ncbi:MAG: hypothetical protein U0L11_08655 [Acutalibacteraceae bacterium]|nr:hypothetical protein [Acutalibacteraceae bacterium]
MKKIISLILVAVMCLAFASCSAFDGRKKVREQADTAPVFSMVAYAQMFENNEVRAKEKYEGKVFKFTGEVYEVNERYCFVNGIKYMQVFLEKEDLLKLNKGQEYTFVGVFEQTPFYPTLKDAILLDD